MFIICILFNLISRGRKMKKEWSKTFITPQKFHDDILKLAQLIPKDKYSLMVGIPRGGYIIAVYLSHYFDLAWIGFENSGNFRNIVIKNQY